MYGDPREALAKAPLHAGAIRVDEEAPTALIVATYALGRCRALPKGAACADGIQITRLALSFPVLRSRFAGLPYAS